MYSFTGSIRSGGLTITLISELYRFFFKTVKISGIIPSSAIYPHNSPKNDHQSNLRKSALRSICENPRTILYVEQWNADELRCSATRIFADSTGGHSCLIYRKNKTGILLKICDFNPSQTNNNER